MKAKMFLFFCLASLCALSTHASLYQPQGIGGGGAFTSFSMSPYDPNLWFVATDMGILFRSLDQGASWQPVDQAQIFYSSNLHYSAPLGFCADPNIVLFANEGRNPIRSIDKGSYWFPVSMSLNAQERIKYWTPNSQDENTILCATDERLLKSTDKGVTWQACNISGPSKGTFFDYAENDIYHATAAGIYRSGNMGMTFEFVHAPAVLPLHGFAGGRDSNGLTLSYIDGDGVNAVGPWIQAYIGMVDGATQEDYNLSVATSGFVWVKGPGNANFDRVSHTQTYSGIGVVSSYLYGGGNLRFSGTPFEVSRDQHNHGGIFMAENNSQMIYVTGNIYWPRMYGQKTFVTENAGTNWQLRYLNCNWDAGYTPWPADRLEHSAVGIEVGWWDNFYDNFTINQKNAAMAGGTGYFFLHVTKDRGQHWLAPFTEFADLEPRTAGKRWKSTGLEDTAVHRIKFNPYNTQLVYMGLSDIGGFMSEDGGETIRMCDAGYNTNYDYAFDPTNDDVVFAACSSMHMFPYDFYKFINYGRGGIFRSNDRGRTWTRLTPDTVADPGGFNRNFLSVAYDPGHNVVYGGTHGGGIARSVNGGQWEYINSGIPQGNGRVISQIEVDASGHVYALLSGDFLSYSNHTNATQTGIYHLAYGTSTWQLLRGTVHNPPGMNLTEFWPEPVRFAVDPQNSNVLWLVDYIEEYTDKGEGIWKSTDRGQNWYRMYPHSLPADIIIDPNNSNHVFVSGQGRVNSDWINGGMVHTEDGGSSWRMNARLPIKNIGSTTTLDPNDPTHIWYGFIGGGILHGPRPENLSHFDRPTAPQNVHASGEPGRVTVTWTASTTSTGIKKYLVYRRGGSPANVFLGATENITFMTEAETNAGTTYGYLVIAEDLEGDISPQSNVFWLDALPITTPSLAAPTSLTAAMVSSAQIHLEWQYNSSGHTGFKIERLNGQNGVTYEQIAMVAAGTTTFENTELIQGCKYFYRVRAYSSSENSYYSNIASAGGASMDSQSIPLQAGWNWLSLHVNPSNLTLDGFFSGIINQVEQVKTQTQSAIRNNGTWQGDLIGMDGIQVGKMYKVRVSAACTLTITGAVITENTPIQLSGGWNWVAYLPTSAKSLSEALDGIKTQVQEVKSLTQSAIWNGTSWSGTLTQMQPGQGYAVRMTANGTLVY